VETAERDGRQMRLFHRETDADRVARNRDQIFDLHATALAWALIDPAIRWETVDERTARAHYTVGPNTVSAVLSFNDAGEWVDFVSDDRSALSADGKEFVRQRWSTPVRDSRSSGPCDS
jgi:hypothetical protein